MFIFILSSCFFSNDACHLFVFLLLFNFASNFSSISKKPNRAAFYLFFFSFENHKILYTSAISLSNSSSQSKTSYNMHELVSKDKNNHERKTTHVTLFILISNTTEFKRKTTPELFSCHALI